MKAPKKSTLRGGREAGPRFPRLAALLDGIYSPLYGVGVAMAIVVLVGAALLHVWTRLEVIRIGYALSEQTKIHRALREHEQRLRLELATQKDPAAIERVAREQLHMAPPDPSSIRIISGPRHAGSPRGSRPPRGRTTTDGGTGTPRPPAPGPAAPGAHP
jgi:cell division protein FtsL